MQRIPFTLEEAIDIAEDFEDLIGTELNRMPPITYVAVGPYDLGMEPGYIQIIDSNAGNSEFQYSYSGDDYDVYVIWTKPDSDTDEIIDIRTIAQAIGIPYKFPSDLV